MHIFGNRSFVEIPGSKQHELPPLCIHRSIHLRRLDKIMDAAAAIVEDEDMIAGYALLEDPKRLEERKMDIAIRLVEEYQEMVLRWRWGDDVLEWIRQCEITFGSRPELRNLISADVWPHAGRSSFVQLLHDKNVSTEGINMEQAVGLRLAFRKPPPIACFSNQFLFYLNDSVSNSTYQTWASKNPDPVSSLPPERFTLQVLEM